MKDQFARNVWSMNLEVQTEAAKQVYIRSGNLNWTSLSLEEQDKAMFDILILLITCASPSRSILLDNPYRNVPRKKLQSYCQLVAGFGVQSKTIENCSNNIIQPFMYMT